MGRVGGRSGHIYLRVAILTQGNSAPHGATRKQANLVLLGDREGDGRSSFDDAIVIDALSVLAQALSINSVDFTKLTALL